MRDVRFKCASCLIHSGLGFAARARAARPGSKFSSLKLPSRIRPNGDIAEGRRGPVAGHSKRFLHVKNPALGDPHRIQPRVSFGPDRALLVSMYHSCHRCCSGLRLAARRLLAHSFVASAIPYRHPPSPPSVHRRPMDFQLHHPVSPVLCARELAVVRLPLAILILLLHLSFVRAWYVSIPT